MDIQFMTYTQFTSVDFVIKLFIPVFMLSRYLTRKSRFSLRLIAAMALLLICCIAMPFLLLNLLPDSIASLVNHLFLLLAVLAGEYILYDASVTDMVFNLIGGQAVYQLVLLLFTIIAYQFTQFSFDVYLSASYFLWQVPWFAAMYTGLYWCYFRHVKMTDHFDSLQPSLYAALLVSVFLICFNWFRGIELVPGSLMDYLCIICIILFYLIIIILRSGVVRFYRSERELMLARKVWEEKEKSLRLTNETVRMLNIKYHDLKHFSANLAKATEVQTMVDDVTRTMDDFVCTFDTGNDTLDMILTEQLIKFRQHQTDFVSIADGSLLGFMSSLDIISLFSNALDNADEAVVSQPISNRQVYLTVKKTAVGISISFENPLSSQIVMQGGLPKTSKQDTNYHGFGMESIHNVVVKYGGTMDIGTDDGWFRLRILLPAQGGEAASVEEEKQRALPQIMRATNEARERLIH